MNPLDLYFRLVGPLAAKIALGAGEYGTGIGIDEEFGGIAVGEPVGISVDDLDDLFRLTVYWQLTWPCQGRST